MIGVGGNGPVGNDSLGKRYSVAFITVRVPHAPDEFICSLRPMLRG
jgi:hypothetical protein